MKFLTWKVRLMLWFFGRALLHSKSRLDTLHLVFAMNFCGYVTFQEARSQAELQGLSCGRWCDVSQFLPEIVTTKTENKVKEVLAADEFARLQEESECAS